MKDQVTAQDERRLLARHEELADQVDRLERRAHLTPDEEREVAELKKKKLQAKTALAELQRQA